MRTCSVSKKVAVIGAGITGITTAYYLAKKGYNVTVYEKERYPAMKTSYANGGQISVSNSEVWTTWSNVKKGIKWIFTKDAPLLFRPSLDFKQWKWIVKFIYHTFKGHHAENTAKTVRMGIESRKLYDEICMEESMDFDRKSSGIVHFYKSQEYYESTLRVNKIYHANGLDREIIDPNELKNIDQSLSSISGVIGATATHTDWTGDIHKFCYQMAEILKTKYDVGFVYNSVATNYGIDTMTGVFDAVVVCAGVNSPEIAKQVGDTLDIYPVKGYSITINNVDKTYLPRVSLLDDQAKIVTASLGSRFRVAGTAELNGENYDIRRDRIEPLLNWVHTNFPNINTHDYTSYACLRPMTPNMMPITKQSDKNKKVYYNTGHGHLGWTLGPVTAKQIADMI